MRVNLVEHLDELVLLFLTQAGERLATELNARLLLLGGFLRALFREADDQLTAVFRVARALDEPGVLDLGENLGGASRV